MQIKHTINQTNIQYSKTHDFGEIKNISRQIHNATDIFDEDVNYRFD